MAASNAASTSASAGDALAQQQQEHGVQALMDAIYPTYRHSYSERDVCLYALGVGCGAADLRCAAPL